GAYPFSEAETQAYRDFTNSHDFDIVLNLHSYGRMLVEPDGCDSAPPSLATYTEISNSFHLFSGYADHTVSTLLNQTVGGDANSWVRHEATGGPVAFAPEVGAPKETAAIGSNPSWEGFIDGFYPPFSETLATGNNLRRAFLQVALAAGPSLEITEHDWQTMGCGADPGEEAHLLLTVRSNGSDATGAGDLTITSSSPWVSVAPGHDTVSLPALPVGSAESIHASTLIVLIDEAAPVGHTAVFDIAIHDGFTTRHFAHELRLGTPVPWIVADAETASDDWLYDSTWARTDLDGAHGGEWAYSDSPGGDYGHDVDASLSLAADLDLTGWDNLWLDHHIDWGIWYKTDFGSLELSTDGGTNWNPVAPVFGHLGYGNGVQESCVLGYTGSSRGWRPERFDLSSFAGESGVRLRYRLRSAGSQYSEQGDGLKLDDIHLYSYPDASQQITWVGTVVLDRDFVVPAGQTLVVVSGAEVVVAASDALNQGNDPARVEIIVQGSILCEGTAGDEIDMHGELPGGSVWAGLVIDSVGRLENDLAHLILRDTDIGLQITPAGQATLASVTAPLVDIAGSAHVVTQQGVNGGDRLQVATGGEFLLETGGSFTIVAGGEVDVASGGRFQIEGSVNNHGSIVIAGETPVTSGGELISHAGSQVQLNTDLFMDAASRFVLLAGAEMTAADSPAGPGFALDPHPDEVDLVCVGQLVLGGAVGEPAVLRAADPAPADWGGVYFDSASPHASYLGQTTISDALVGLDCHGDGIIWLQDGRFEGNTIGARLTGRGSDAFTRCEFLHNTTGIELEQADTEITSCSLHDNNAGISCTGSSPRVRQSTIYNNTVGIRTMDSASLPDLGTDSDWGFNDFVGSGGANSWHIAAMDPADEILAQHNWWGTTKTKAIQARILVAEMDPPACSVEFVPFLQAPPLLPKDQDEMVRDGQVEPAAPETDSRLLFRPQVGNKVTDGIEIAFRTPGSGRVSLGIYDVRGRLVKSLLNETLTAGEHAVVWNGHDRQEQRVASGIYLARLTANNQTTTAKYLIAH
ncbi:MAG: FlgD immunoglobulin-like domain containing protein, partial [bacterium]